MRRYFFYCLLPLLACLRSFAQPALEFVQNQGQWGDWFKYKVATEAGDVCLENDGFRYVLGDPDNNFKVDYFHHGQTKVRPVLKFHVYKVTFEGANTPEITGRKPKKIYYNYFLGNDSTKWHSGIHPYRNVSYKGLYNGIDMDVFSQKGNIEYEFFVAPGVDVSQLKLRFDGQDGLRIKNNNLIVSTTVGEMTEMKPYAYQYINGDKVEVPCAYRLRGNVVTYDFPEGYDHSQQLVIDPIVVFCTLTGSTADNWGFSATYDDAGNFYAGGLVNTIQYGGSFPVSPGAFQTTFGGGYGTAGPTTGYAYAADISIIKYDGTLANRVYATYLGGNGNDHVHSMIVDAAGDLCIAGRTRSTNYPITAGAYQTVNNGGWDMVVTKFNASGTALIGSTYIGGTGNDGVNFDSSEYTYGQLKYNYGDDSRSEIQIDPAGNLYVAACTQSTDFPTTVGAISTTLSGGQDGVVFKLNTGLTSLLWSTYFGGSGYDAGYVLAFNKTKTSVYVAGGTNSNNFPTTPGTYQTAAPGGFADGFIMKFQNSPPYTLQRCTYLGTNAYDQVYGIQVSNTNEVYVMGQTLGAFPVSASYSNPGSSQFAMKLDSNLATDVVSTVFGSGTTAFTNISPVAFLVDTCDNVYISGWGGSLGIAGVASGECTGMATSSDAAQPTTDGRDFYFIVLGPNMSSLRYATYYGRNCATLWEGEHVDGGTSRFSQQGIIYQGICANCGGVPPNPGACPTLFPTTTGVWSEVDSSQNCNEAALKIAFNIGPVTAVVSAGPSTSGCAPLTVNFTNSSTNGLSYLWNFGDGSTSTTFSPTHTFNSAGVYTVTLSASNSNACFRTDDTAYVVIVVDTAKIYPGFTTTLVDSCNPYVASFVNTSTDHIGTPSYKWLLGDGTVYVGTTPPDHSYADTGTYTVMLIMSDTGACKSPDTVIHTIHFFNLFASANFTIPDSLCLGTPFTPNINFTNITSTLWTWGDGTTSTSYDPSHTYGTANTFTVTVIALNTGGCGGGDTVSQVITILPLPTANFSYVPTVPVANIPTTFTNLSTNAVRYMWDFGDSNTSTEVNPVHQYNKTGMYKVCLTAYNIDGCPAVVCKTAPAEVEPLIGLPTAFSPNGDGENDVLYVRGAAIKTLNLKIFNRWGQLVFETNTQTKGWDGTFNGQPQPVEAYAYVLNATFIDGTSKVLKGNITLLR